jgi:tetratricopeptide (TPR) repeat protein
MLGERGDLVDAPLPENVQGIIAARLDGLSRPEKNVLQSAAVLGKVFWSDALVALEGDGSLEDLLHGLERKDFVERARRSSVAGSTEYAFRHVLVRDVAYGQIPRADRSEKHSRVAEWFESLGRAEDHAETLAHHYVSSLELARAAGEDTARLEERARVALLAAADRAASLNAFGHAVRFYREALELWPSDDPGRPDLLFRLGSAQRMTDETGMEALGEAVPGLIALGDVGTAAEAEATLAELSGASGDRQAVKEHLARAAELVRELPSSPAKALVLSELARFHMLSGALERAVEVAAEALPMAEAHGSERVRASLLNTRGVARVYLGDRAGVADVEASLALAKSIVAPFEIMRAYTNLSAVAGFLGNDRRALQLNVENLQVAERLGAIGISRWLRANLALGYFVVGEWDEAFRLADDFLDAVEAGVPHVLEFSCRLTRADIRLGRGDELGAEADAERAVEAARVAASPRGLVAALARYARVLSEVGKAGEAGDIFDEVVSLALETDPRVLGDPECAFMAHALGRAEDVRPAFERVTTLADNPWARIAMALLGGDLAGAADRIVETGNAFWEARLRLAAAEELVHRGRRAEADEQLRKALGFFRAVGATRYVRQGEALLAASA